MPAPVSMYIKLKEDVAAVLGRVSRRERRNPRDQAALFIEDGLRRAGDLIDAPADHAAPAEPEPGR